MRVVKRILSGLDELCTSSLNLSISTILLNSCDVPAT